MRIDFHLELKHVKELSCYTSNSAPCRRQLSTYPAIRTKCTIIYVDACRCIYNTYIPGDVSFVLYRQRPARPNHQMASQYHRRDIFWCDRRGQFICFIKDLNGWLLNDKACSTVACDVCLRWHALSAELSDILNLKRLKLFHLCFYPLHMRFLQHCNKTAIRTNKRFDHNFKD